MSKVSYTNEEESNFMEEDPRSEVIKNLTDPEEIRAAQELFEEKYGVPKGETTPADDEPAESEKPADTSEPEATDTTDEDNKGDVEDGDGKKPIEKPEDTPDVEPSEKTELAIDDNVLNKHKENAEILAKYKGKSKADIAKAAANAIAVKNEYLKGNEKAIEGIAEKLAELPDDELLTKLIETQKDVGRQEKPDDYFADREVELPVLPDDPKVQSIVEEQIIQRLKKKYKSFPDSLNSEEYLDFEREIREEKGGLGEAQLIADIKAAKDSVNEDLQKYVYAQSNLPNLYVENPVEVYNYLNEYSLGQLKSINDNFTKINDQILRQEVETIRKELESKGLTPEDIGISLELETVDGSLYNKDLYPLLFNDKELDNDVVKPLGKIVLLKKNGLTKKFKSEFESKILTAYVDKKTARDDKKREEIKDTNLNTLTTGSQNGEITPKDVTKITDPQTLQKIMQNIEAKYN